MVFGYLRGLIFISVLQLVLSIPLESLGESTETILVTAVITTQLEVLETTTIFSPNPLPTSPGELPSNELDSSTSEILVVTAIVTETPTTTITVTEIPSGSTDITTALPSTSQTSLPQRVWAAPSQFTDLSSFKVSSFPYGQHNLQLVTQPPTNDTATLAIPQVQAVAAGTNATLSEPQQYPSLGAPPLEDPHSLLQIFYPQGSINPGSDIQGGADFYASPLDLSRARSVSLEYSVFFPVGFEWALAGKLPGLYGGHTGCSGGNNARTCFSTRLMWRKEGKGELYLYAPKDKQTEGLCSTPPQSVCDADYGLSVGRGSFHFLTGDWTRLRQTVSLNTPGKQDGGFSLIVSGHEVISRSDVFYRDVPIPTHTSPLSTVQPSPSPTQPSNGGLLDGLIGGLLGGLENVFSRVADPQVWGIYVMPNGLEEAYHIAPIFHAGSEPSYLGPRDLPLDVATSSDANGALALGEPIVSSPLLTKIIPPTTPTVTQLASLPEVVDLVQKPRPVGFSGLFFSTFFGGHDTQYASPKDQYVWFRDFAVTVNEES